MPKRAKKPLKKKPQKTRKNVNNVQKCNNKKIKQFTRIDKKCQKVQRRGNLIVLVLLSTDFNRFSVS